MTRNEAFELCLEKHIKPKVKKGVWASYLHRYKRGGLKQTTITELLHENGFVVTQEEQWHSSEHVTKSVDVAVVNTLKDFIGKEITPETKMKMQGKILDLLDKKPILSMVKEIADNKQDPTEEKYITLAVFDKSNLRFRLRTIQADTFEEAKKKNKGEGVDVTDDMYELINFVNKTIEQYNS